MAIKRARTLSRSEARNLISRTLASSQWAERDQLLLLLGMTCGMRVTEIARVKVADVVEASGAIRKEVNLSSAITKGGRRRSVFLTHERTRNALDRYLSWRVSKNYGVNSDSRYRGLDPASTLILTPTGQAYSLSAKRRRTSTGGLRTYWAADGLQAYVSLLYTRAQIGSGFSSHSGRRTFATRLVEEGTQFETVQALLGHVDLDHVSVYIDIDKSHMREAVRRVL